MRITITIDSTDISLQIRKIRSFIKLYLSPTSIKWRLEARRSGKSFAEVVLLHTLIYRVEQVFLIHKPSGLLLCHVAADDIVSQPPELVSGMLMAIQDFMKNFAAGSFDGSDSTLSRLEVGDLAVWLEEGPKAVIATVVKGQAPQEFRLELQEAIEKLHVEQCEALYNYTGQNVSEECQPYLQSCLKMELMESSKGIERFLVKRAF